MSTTYKPINCNFHELLLAKATLQELCEIKYTSKTKASIVNSIIIDVYTKKSEEFLTLDSGEIIRLDKIISINNEPLPESRCAF